MFFSVILVAIAAAYVYYYNHFIKMANLVKEAWADVDTQLKHRYELTQQIITLAESYVKTSELESIINRRNCARSATTIKERQNCENSLIDGLQNFFDLADNYPELASNDEFVKLQYNFSAVEKELQKSRQNYNKIVGVYNSAIINIPSSWIAKSMHIKAKTLFEISDLEKQSVEIDIAQS